MRKRNGIYLYIFLDFKISSEVVHSILALRLDCFAPSDLTIFFSRYKLIGFLCFFFLINQIMIRILIVAER